MDEEDPWGPLPDWFGDGKGEDDEEEEEPDNMPGAQHCLILLDCHASMFDACLPDPDFPEDQQSPMDVALKACEKLVRTKVRMTVVEKSGKRDGFGILLYNTKNRKKVTEEDMQKEADGDQRMKKEEEEDEDEIFAGPINTTCHEFVPLEPPGVSTVQKIHAATDDPIRGRSVNLQELYEAKGDEKESLISPLELGLHQALEALRTSKCIKKPSKNQPADYKQIWVFTNDSDPTSGNEEKLKVLKTAIEDSSENDVFVTLWSMPSRSGKFDDSVYQELGIFTPEEDWNWKDETVLEDMLRQQWKKPRSAMSLPLILPDWKEHENYQIMVDFYRLVQRRTLPTAYPIHQETGKVLKRMTQQVGAEGGDILEEKIAGSNSGGITPSGRLRLRGYHEFGGERLYFSQEDLATMKVQGNANKEFASLILLGFKPKDALPFKQTLDSTYFLYPNEEKVEGSSMAFAHLHASMLRKNVVAIGELLTRVESPSRLVAMWPIEEEVKKEEMGDQVVARLIRPPGMLCVKLPFEDEIRNIAFNEATKTSEESEETGPDLPSEELIKAAVDLVNKQTYQEGVEIGENFENDCLVRFWDYVEHVALNEPLSETERSLVVDKEAVLKAAGLEIESFKRLLPEDVKRGKKTTKRKIIPDDSGIDWEGLFIEGSIDSQKVANLKKKLKSAGEKTTGNKPDLVDRVEKLLEKELTAQAAKKVKEET